MQRISVVIRVPDQPDKEIVVTAGDAAARHAAGLVTAAASNHPTSAAAGAAGAASAASVNAPDAKKRKLDVASSVADRAGGPGMDPTSRFAYVYTGKHDHGALELEQERVSSVKWSGVSSALSEMKLKTDTYLTGVINSEAQ
jgi:hypothetical protein